MRTKLVYNLIIHKLPAQFKHFVTIVDVNDENVRFSQVKSVDNHQLPTKPSLLLVFDIIRPFHVEKILFFHLNDQCT